MRVYNRNSIRIRIYMHFKNENMEKKGAYSKSLLFIGIHDFIYVISFQTDAHTRTSILTFLAIMAQSDGTTNTANSNGTTRQRFEMPLARSRNHFLQQKNVGGRLIEASEQYATPPLRVSRILKWF